MCILEKLNFKISRGNMRPDPLSVLAPLALDPILSILAGPTLNCFRRASISREKNVVSTHACCAP